MNRPVLTGLLLIAALAVPIACGAAPLDMKTMTPYTSFQTPTEYRADNDIRTDAVIVYSDIKERIQSWRDKGYVVQTMYGFRTGPDYIKDHRDEVQTTADGTLHTCGPNSYYMVPTPARIKAALDYFTHAITNGTSAVIPEEPEFFAITGYSDSFKKAWQSHYGEPWQDQTTSIQARYKSERLKAKMEHDMVKAIMDAAQKQNPGVRRMVACHSAVSYYAWGIIYPHYECFTIPNLQEIIGQVWTGTARSACRYEGQMAERTFENGFLEYSSLYNLVRGSGKRMWFLMDPLEDNPDRSMEDYHTNYEKTLVASLMFPEVDAYEVMPWPTRIYGRVPAEFATEIGSIISALEDMHNQKQAQWDSGTRGIATFVADSMAWQRGAPSMSNYDCFYGLTLPLVYKGIPIQVAQLERTPDKGYLNPYKVILMSYDIMKPMKPEYNQAIADWVKRGGVLVFFGGTDAYNALPEWWRKAGFDSPGADLLHRLGVKDESPSAGGDTDVREHRCGKGVLMRIGASPSYFASSPEAADRLRTIAADACKAAGLEYREQQHMAIRRGPYVAVRTFDGEKKLTGSYVDILDPKLAVANDPVIGPQKCALYCDVTSALRSGRCKLLFASGKIEEFDEASDHLRLRVSGPAGTRGAVRVYYPITCLGPRYETTVDGILLTPADCVSVNGIPMGARHEDPHKPYWEAEGNNLLITYDNKPESVEIEIKWR